MESVKFRRVWGMKNLLEKKMDNEMRSGGLQGLGVHLLVVNKD